MRLSLTRTVGFRASHRFHKPEWTAEENRARFGAVGEAPGHAHDYRFSVTVSGPLDPGTDTIVDLVALDRDRILSVMFVLLRKVGAAF